MSDYRFMTGRDYTHPLKRVLRLGGRILFYVYFNYRERLVSFDARQSLFIARARKSEKQHLDIKPQSCKQLTRDQRALFGTLAFCNKVLF